MMIASQPFFFNLIELTFLCVYLSLKLHILFYINGLAIWHGLSDNEPQKAHLHPLRDVCVQYEMDPPMGLRDLLRKRNVARYIRHNKVKLWPMDGHLSTVVEIS